MQFLIKLSRTDDSHDYYNNDNLMINLFYILIKNITMKNSFLNAKSSFFPSDIPIFILIVSVVLMKFLKILVCMVGYVF